MLVTLIKPDVRYNITPIIGTMTWDTDFTLLSSLEFELVYSDAHYPTPRNPVDPGDHIIVTRHGNEVFRGVIELESMTGRSPIKYTAYDYTWYLAQSTTVMQFNRVPASVAIERVLTEFGIQIGNIPYMPTIIDQIYIEKSPAHILNDIITTVENAEGYRINGEMREGRIYLERHTDLIIQGRFRLADNLPEQDVLTAVSEPKRSRSIADMRNRIRLIIDDEVEDEQGETQASYIETALVQDDELIDRYGLLEETVKMKIEDSAKAREAARVLLRRLGRVHEENELKLLGDIRFKAGRLFEVHEPITGMSGLFVISSAKHRFTKRNHFMDLTLISPEEVG